jgi:hypothetical protein
MLAFRQGLPQFVPRLILMRVVKGRYLDEHSVRLWPPEFVPAADQ